MSIHTYYSALEASRGSFIVQRVFSPPVVWVKGLFFSIICDLVFLGYRVSSFQCKLSTGSSLAHNVASQLLGLICSPVASQLICSPVASQLICSPLAEVLLCAVHCWHLPSSPQPSCCSPQAPGRQRWRLGLDAARSSRQPSHPDPPAPPCAEYIQDMCCTVHTFDTHSIQWPPPNNGHLGTIGNFVKYNTIVLFRSVVQGEEKWVLA